MPTKEKMLVIIKKYEIKYKIFDPEYRKCSDDASSYRSVAATGIEKQDNGANVMVMYPSVMSSTDARLTVVNTTEAAFTLEVHSIAGQLISSSQVSSGKNEIELNGNGNLSEGIYLVKVYDANRSVTTVNKILITK